MPVRLEGDVGSHFHELEEVLNDGMAYAQDGLHSVVNACQQLAFSYNTTVVIKAKIECGARTIVSALLQRAIDQLPSHAVRARDLIQKELQSVLLMPTEVLDILKKERE